MKCSICKTGTTYKGKTTCTIEKEGTLLVFRDVEAEICDNCGEAYFSLETTNKIQLLVAEAVNKGAEIEIVRLAS
ncbi:hypothetical protein BH11BAC6_BH11BAC6_02520 [soil metagenome]